MEKASSESTPPSQFSALCQQQGPAVALCPVVNLSAAPQALNPQLYVAPSDRASDATFHSCSTGRLEVAGKMNVTVKGRFNVIV